MSRVADFRAVPAVRNLRPGLDYRQPAYRREVFLRFYEFHLTYRAHPGGVYYLMPYLANHYGWDLEAKLWFAFINGNTQHPPTSWRIFMEFPELPRDSRQQNRLHDWFNRNWKALAFDMDRRYQKKDFPASVACYTALVKKAGGLQSDLLAKPWKELWPLVRTDFYTFGRLASFSYLEYLRIMGLDVECPTLLLDDLSGSKSHRNGLAKVLGRDDLDWHDESGFDGKYLPGEIEWLAVEGRNLLAEARHRFQEAEWFRDVGYFTLESTLCCYKSWFRKNRRYPNVYNDMMHQRLVDSETAWPGYNFEVFWEARRAALPPYLRLEDNPDDPGLCPAKQNHFRNTGQVILMGKWWSCFDDDGSWRRKTPPASTKTLNTSFWDGQGLA